MSCVLDLVEHITERCDSVGVGLTLAPVDSVKSDRVPCSGYYDGKQICVAASAEVWWMTLAHEYAHMYQEKWDAYWQPRDAQVDEAHSVFNAYIAGERVSLRKATAACRMIQRHEAFAERFAIRLARNYGVLPPGAEQHANAYLRAYEVVRRNRKWWGQHTTTQTIIDVQPHRVLPDRRLKDVPPELEMLYLQEWWPLRT